MLFLVLRTLKVHVVLLSVSILFLTTSCQDDEHNHDEEGHTDADGFILENESGTEVYREFEGAVTGSVDLNVGDTLELSVHFLDHDGEEITHEEGDEVEEEEELSLSGFNSAIAIVEAEEHEEESDQAGEEEHHEMGIHIIGVSSGQTEFQLQLMHEGHADYTSTEKVQVTVN